MSSLKKLAIRGAVWTILSYGISQILRFGGNLILTRLLVPELFGLIALVYVFISGLHLFSDLGIGPSIVQNKRGEDPVFLNTAWTIQVIRSLAIWLICLAIAWPIANFYGDSRLQWLIPVVGFNSVISGFNSTALSSLNRQMLVGKLAIFELIGQLITLIIMVIWAWFSPTVWALVIGNSASALFQLVGSHLLMPGWKNRFTWDREAATEIFSFGRWIFLSTAIYFLCSQADRLILGKLFTLEMLGVYGIAYSLADMPRQVILAVSGKVIFPAISQLSELPRPELRSKILKNRQLILLGLAILLVIFVGFGDRLILTLYNEKFAAAAWIMPILALGIWHTTLYSTMSPTLLALGKPHYAAQGSFFTFLAIAIGIPLGFFLQGHLGAVIAVAIGDLPTYGIILYGLWREDVLCLGQDLKLTVLFLTLLAAVLWIRVTLGWGLPIQQLLPG